MSIYGNLDDVSVAEVMQFIHLGGRTGTLALESPHEKAEVGFHRGKIISAWTPSTIRLGDALVAARLITEQDLARVLERQETERPRVPFGQLLVTMGVVDKEQLHEVVTAQIEETIYEIVAWRQGTFHFALDELRPIDETALYPGDILPDINLNTQVVILEALRIFDEKNRGDFRAPQGDDWNVVDALFEGTAPPAEVTKAPLSGTGRQGTPILRLQVVSDDEAFINYLKTNLSDSVTEIAAVEPREAGLAPPGEVSPIVVMDLRDPRVDLHDLEFVRRAHERASLIAVLNDDYLSGAVYGAGVLAAVPADPRAVAACVRSVADTRRSNVVPAAIETPTNPGFARLRRVAADLRSGLLSTTVALNLMQVISENVERAIMFLVRGNDLVAAGAFGFSADKQPLSATTRGMRLALDTETALAAAIENGQTRSIRFEEVNLPAALTEVLGRPRTGQSVIFPVVGSDRVISVVYADNGSVGDEIKGIELVELAAAQVGVAFENEILRRKLEELAH